MCVFPYFDNLGAHSQNDILPQKNEEKATR